MRIMLDTNVLISLLLFPNARMKQMMEYIFTKHELVLSSFVLDELRDVIARKFQSKVFVIERLLLKMEYEYVNTPDNIKNDLFEIRDVDDYPVLYTAIISDIDVLITGDKDFFDVEIEIPEILTPAEYIEKYVYS